MNELSVNIADISDKTQLKAIEAHEYLVNFLEKFHTSRRGSIHDMMEAILCNMLNLSHENIDKYLASGHKNVIANEIMAIVTDSFQKVLDGVKRNLEAMEQVYFK